MRIHLRFLRRRELIEEALRADGWQLERDRDDCVTAQHPLVKDEASARIRLQELRLLTSASVYIEFIRSNTHYFVSTGTGTHLRTNGISVTEVNLATTTAANHKGRRKQADWRRSRIVPRTLTIWPVNGLRIERHSTRCGAKPGATEQGER